MKSAGYILLSLIFVCCAPKCEDIDGQWKVISPFYIATFKIAKVEGKLKCAVLTYNDGTTSFDNRDKSPYYLAQNLKCDGEIYVDGISGATTINEQGLKMQIINNSTMSVTTYIMNKPLTEKWMKYEE